MQLQATLLAALSLTAFASAQSYVETFDGGSNVGDWTFGIPQAETIETSGGNPGAYLQNLVLDTFAPQAHTQGLSVFTGDWRARGVTNFGADFRTYFTNFPYMREASLVLTDSTGCAVYFLGTDFIPQVNEGWKSFDYTIDSASTTIPAGWARLDNGSSCTDDDATWNQVIQDVVDVTVFYGNPTFFFIFDQWHVGMDNMRISEGFGTNYCTSNANSTGSPAIMSASGSSSVAANNLVLHAESLPAGQSGVFYYGSDQDLAVFGNGFRCVTGAAGLGRLPIEVVDGSGVLSHALDNTMPPIPALLITAGSTWNFQAWFRDPAAGGAFFDLSDGLEITFQP